MAEIIRNGQKMTVAKQYIKPTDIVTKISPSESLSPSINSRYPNTKLGGSGGGSKSTPTITEIPQQKFSTVTQDIGVKKVETPSSRSELIDKIRNEFGVKSGISNLGYGQLQQAYQNLHTNRAIQQYVQDTALKRTLESRGQKEIDLTINPKTGKPFGLIKPFTKKPYYVDVEFPKAVRGIVEDIKKTGILGGYGITSGINLYKNLKSLKIEDKGVLLQEQHKLILNSFKRFGSKFNELFPEPESEPLSTSWYSDYMNKMETKRLRGDTSQLTSLGIASLAFGKTLVYDIPKGTYDLFRHPVRSTKGTIQTIKNSGELGRILKERPEELAGQAIAYAVAPKVYAYTGSKVSKTINKLTLKKPIQEIPTAELRKSVKPFTRQRATLMLTDEQGNYILGKSRSGELISIGGKIEKGQSSLKAVLAELKQETGLSKKDILNLKFKKKIVTPEETFHVYTAKVKNLGKIKPSSDIRYGVEVISPKMAKRFTGMSAEFPITKKGVRSYELGIINYLETGEKPTWLKVKTKKGEYYLGTQSRYDVPFKYQKKYLKGQKLLLAHGTTEGKLSRGMLSFFEKGMTIKAEKTKRGSVTGLYISPPIKSAKGAGGYVGLSYLGIGAESIEEPILGLKLFKKPTAYLFEESAGKIIKATPKARAGVESELIIKPNTYIKTEGKAEKFYIGGKKVYFQPTKIVKGRDANLINSMLRDLERKDIINTVIKRRDTFRKLGRKNLKLLEEKTSNKLKIKNYPKERVIYEEQRRLAEKEAKHEYNLLEIKFGKIRRDLKEKWIDLRKQKIIDEWRYGKITEKEKLGLNKTEKEMSLSIKKNILKELKRKTGIDYSDKVGRYVYVNPYQASKLSGIRKSGLVIRKSGLVYSPKKYSRSVERSIYSKLSPSKYSFKPKEIPYKPSAPSRSPTPYKYQYPKPKEVYRPIPPTKRIIPTSILPTSLKSEDLRKFRKTGKVETFNVYGKHRGQFIRLNKTPLTEIDALNRGAYAIDHSTARTFKIEPAGRRNVVGTIKPFEANYFKNHAKVFRGYKIRKGRKFQLKQKVIEKKKYAISTVEEKHQLSLARLLKTKSLNKTKSIKLHKK
jgi:hypothetical protein